MRNLFRLLATVMALFGGCFAQQLSHQNEIRIREFYRLASEIQDKIWPQWSAAPAPVLLITAQQEFLTHHPSPPKDFTKVGDDFYAGPRQYPTDFLATFPVFGQLSVIVVGEPDHTMPRTSTPWLITLMHEHFHQLQDAQPGASEDVMKLGLSRGDQTGMWMLNFPFPYDKPELNASFARMRDVLLSAIEETDATKFAESAKQYAAARRQFFAQLTPDDHKYLDFQLWREGTARYTQIKSAEAAADYRPTAEYSALSDYETFAHYAAHARNDTLEELRQADLAKWKRVVLYSWGAAEGLLLDRMNPGWRNDYFKKPFSLDAYFE